eukprot:PhF_6_TR9204/c0_g2_i3/m.14419
MSWIIFVIISAFFISTVKLEPSSSNSECISKLFDSFAEACVFLNSTTQQPPSSSCFIITIKPSRSTSSPLSPCSLVLGLNYSIQCVQEVNNIVWECPAASACLQYVSTSTTPSQLHIDGCNVRGTLLYVDNGYGVLDIALQGVVVDGNNNDTCMRAVGIRNALLQNSEFRNGVGRIDDARKYYFGGGVGILCSSPESNVVISNCTFINNTMESNRSADYVQTNIAGGGCLFVGDAQRVQVELSHFEDCFVFGQLNPRLGPNIRDWGGAGLLLRTSNDVRIMQSKFINCIAQLDGGGAINTVNCSKVTVQQIDVVRGITESGCGGGLSLRNAQVVIVEDATFSKCSTTGPYADAPCGAGVYFFSAYMSSTLVLRRITVRDSFCVTGGTGFCFRTEGSPNVTLKMSDVTFQDLKTSSNSAGIYFALNPYFVSSLFNMTLKNITCRNCQGFDGYWRNWVFRSTSKWNGQLQDRTISNFSSNPTGSSNYIITRTATQYFKNDSSQQNKSNSTNSTPRSTSNVNRSTSSSSLSSTRQAQLSRGVLSAGVVGAVLVASGDYMLQSSRVGTMVKLFQCEDFNPEEVDDSSNPTQSSIGVEGEYTAVNTHLGVIVANLGIGLGAIVIHGVVVVLRAKCDHQANATSSSAAATLEFPHASVNVFLFLFQSVLSSSLFEIINARTWV